MRNEKPKHKKRENKHKQEQDNDVKQLTQKVNVSLPVLKMVTIINFVVE